MATASETLQNNSRDILRSPHYEGNILRFEGKNIQLDKGIWEFEHEGQVNKLDTYSIWSPSHHEEIAERLKNGDRAAAFIMGNFGVVEVRRPEVKEHDPMFETIKRRPRSQNFVAFTNPDDIIDLVDVDRLPLELKQLRWAGARHDIYPDGPLHAVFPLKKNAEVDPGVVRQPEHTLAAFWIPGHWGYEELGNKLRKKVKRGLLGGGSLNVNGEDPSYTSKELYAAFMKNPEWQKEIDFILFDEIAEAARIGRSQTMLSFAEFPPKILRVGSISPEAIEMNIGVPISFEPERIGIDKKYTASSKTKYNRRNNEMSDKRVSDVMAQIERYREFYNSRMHGEVKAPFVSSRRVGHHAV
ncbi:MAG: hypothetical protein Q7T54_05570 [Candidatus Levybacteria bacterium]|nr:hypothetical protein [Candidatus Levybacteria bacterium]